MATLLSRPHEVIPLMMIAPDSLNIYCFLKLGSQFPWFHIYLWCNYLPFFGWSAWCSNNFLREGPQEVNFVSTLSPENSFIVTTYLFDSMFRGRIEKSIFSKNLRAFIHWRLGSRIMNKKSDANLICRWLLPYPQKILGSTFNLYYSKISWVYV